MAATDGEYNIRRNYFEETPLFCENLSPQKCLKRLLGGSLYLIAVYFT